MGKRSRIFKITNKKKEKYVQKQRYDYSKFKGRVIGYLPDGYPILGSKSSLIKPLTNNSMAPYELYDKKEIEYVKREMFIFKKNIGNSLSVW